jgi:type I restriction enzyme, S subunit
VPRSSPWAGSWPRPGRSRPWRRRPWGPFPCFAATPRNRTRRGEPRAGDLVYVREGDVGRCAVVDGSQRFSLGQRVMMFRPNQRLISPRYLMYQLRSPSVLDTQVLVGKTGTTSHHVNIKHLKQVRILTPSLGEQYRIEAYLSELENKCESLKRLQAETAAELDALLPSVLDRAFKGKL